MSTVTFPLGPYAPVTPQPIALTLRLRGETVAGVEPPQTGYCHRGIAALVEGKLADAALTLLEHSCSFAGTAHRTALCRALEAAAGVQVSRPARLTRVLFLETERILARLWNLGATAAALGAEQFWRLALDQREALFAALEDATGARRFWGVPVPGGARGDLDVEPLRAALEVLDPALGEWRNAVTPQGVLGRAGKGAGVLRPERARELGLAGLAASGAADDLRRSGRDPEYGGLDVPEYGGLDVPAASETQRDGDIAGRLAWAVDDLAASLGLARECLRELPAGSGETIAALKLPAGERTLTAEIEGPHGPVSLAVVRASDGTLRDLRLGTTAPAALGALPEALEGIPMGRAAATLASLDFCAECLEL